MKKKAKISVAIIGAIIAGLLVSNLFFNSFKPKPIMAQTYSDEVIDLADVDETNIADRLSRDSSIDDSQTSTKVNSSVEERAFPAILLEAISIDSDRDEDEMHSSVFFCTASTQCQPIIRYNLEKLHGFQLSPSGVNLLAALFKPDGSLQLYLTDITTGESIGLTDSPYLHYFLS
jgi:hypothetical protein